MFGIWDAEGYLAKKSVLNTGFEAEHREAVERGNVSQFLQFVMT